ncbi:MAG: hypothetical protein KME50_00960 [Nostoc desertorum CM1-VF14]|jgi:transposase|nr:hypothetical protein [Nostoc desertorum CM1-VF14]
MAVVIRRIAVHMEELIKFIQANPDPRELKRALSVKMVMQNYNHSEIAKILTVSIGFVNKCKYKFLEQGVSGLRLKYKGSKSYLSQAQKQTVLTWLQHKEHWNLLELKEYLFNNFDVEFKSKQSYYNLLNQANIAGKKCKKQSSKQRIFSS